MSIQKMVRMVEVSAEKFLSVKSLAEFLQYLIIGDLRRLDLSGWIV